MKKFKWKLNIDWRSKFIDLLIVIIGITIAFQLNNLDASNKSNAKEKDYLKSFYEENKYNESSLASALDFSMKNKNDVDTLKQILISKNYTDKRIKGLIASMMGMASINASITTMENITASGEFELLKEIELRKSIINTYNTYKTTNKLESILTDYVNIYLTPFLFENVRFSDFSSIDSNFIKEPKFENIVFGYEVLLDQQIKGYQLNLEKVRLLDQLLTNSKRGNN